MVRAPLWAIVLALAFPPPAEAGTFSVTCPWADPPGFAKIDPIVSYGAPSAHAHVFKGNRTISATSTFASLRAAAREQSTCQRAVDTDLPGSGDLSAYWVPALYRQNLDGTSSPIPIVTNATYYGAAHYDPAKVQPIPAGLKLLAGDPKATSVQPASRISWSCRSGILVRQAWGPQCVGATQGGLQLRARFPSCWDGTPPSDAATSADPRRVNYDDSDPRRPHVVYPVAVYGNGTSPWTCPSRWPTPIPEILLLVDFQTAGGPDVYVSNRSRYGEHADYFDAWDPAVMRRLVDNCIRVPDVNCGGGDNPLAVIPGPAPPPLPLPPASAGRALTG